MADITVIPTSEITSHIAATTLWFFGFRTPAAYKPSDWREGLIRLISMSDEENQGKLATVYPGEVAAVALAKTFLGGMDELGRIAAP
jgi:hypothetical protein